MSDHQMIQRKLGKLAAKYDPKAPNLLNHKFLARKAPPKLIRDHINPNCQMDSNDSLGDCGEAGFANAARAQAALAGYTLTIPTEKTVALYSQVTGYSPDKPGSDQGTVILDLLAKTAQSGFDIGQQTPLFPLWGTLEPKDLNGIRMVMAALGPVMVGVGLALADQNATTLDTTNPGDQTFDSWGGHLLLAYDYDGTEPDSLVKLITWGTWNTYRATWRWLMARMDEAFAVSFRQLVPANILGVNFKEWESEVAEYAQDK